MLFKRSRFATPAVSPAGSSPGVGRAGRLNWLLMALLLSWLGAVRGQAQPNVPLGGNLDAVSDYTQSRPFADAFLGNRGFGSPDRPWTGDNLPQLDADGWPLSDFGVIVAANLGDAAFLYGTYHLSFQGRATVSPTGGSSFTVQNYQYNSATNTSTADLVVPQVNGQQIMLAFRNLGTGGVRNIKCMLPGYSAGDTFTTPFKNHLQRFSTLRFMDWARTNSNPVRGWWERTLPTSPTQATAKGVAWEYCIQLCNELRKDMWVNVPLNADDNYVAQLAQLIHNRLDPSLNVYVEYSNEVWNTAAGFAQSGDNQRQAEAEVAAGNSNLSDGGAGRYQWGMRRVARRLVFISNVFKQEFGAAALNTRVRPVLAGQYVNPDATLREGLRFIEQHYGAPKSFLYGVAVAPYFNLDPDQTTDGLSTQQVLDRLRANSDAIFNAPGSSALEQDAAVATWFGLHLLGYEGGPDTYGGGSVAAKKAASLDPAIKPILQDYLTRWYARGGELMNWFVAGATSYDTEHGTWGLTNSMANLNTPKIQALDAVLAAARPALDAGFDVSNAIDTRQFVGYAGNWQTQNPYNRYLHAGDFDDYFIRVGAAGSYGLRVRVLAPPQSTDAVMRVWVDNAVAGTITTPATNSNDYNRFVVSPSLTLTLSGGLHVLRLEYTTENYANQTLSFAPAGNTGTGGLVSGGVYRLSPVSAPDKCLDADLAVRGNGANVQQYAYAGTANQQWRLERLPDTSWRLVNLNSPAGLTEVLDVTHCSPDNNDRGQANVQLWQWLDSDCQHWWIDVLPDGSGRLSPKSAPGKCLDVAGGPSATGNGTNVHQWDWLNAANQHWQFTLLSAPAGRGQGTLASGASKGLNAELSVYPNPAAGQLSVQVPAAAQGADARLTLCDATGHVVRQLALARGTARAQLDVQGLAPGLYLLQLSQGRQVLTQKIEVRH